MAPLRCQGVVSSYCFDWYFQHALGRGRGASDRRPLAERPRDPTDCEGRPLLCNGVVPGAGCLLPFPSSKLHSEAASSGGGLLHTYYSHRARSLIADCQSVSSTQEPPRLAAII